MGFLKGFHKDEVTSSPTLLLQEKGAKSPQETKC